MTSPAPAPPGPSPLTSLRITMGTLLVSPVVLTLMLTFVLWPDREPLPPWSILAVFVLTAAGFLLAQLTGYPKRPVAGKTPEERGRASVERFRSELILRFALTEAPVVMSIILSFIVRNPIPLYAGASLSIVSMAWHTWPGERTIAEAQERYSADGQPAYLREALEGHPVPDA